MAAVGHSARAAGADQVVRAGDVAAGFRRCRWSAGEPVLPATIVSVSVTVPELERPPPVLAELPLMVQSVSVAVPPAICNPPPFKAAELPLMVQLVSVRDPESFSIAPPELEAVLPARVVPES